MAMTFKGLREAARKWEKAKTEAAELRKAAITQTKEIYGGELLKQNLEIIEQAYNLVAVDQKRELKQDVEDLRAKKLEQLKISVAKAPTLEQAAKLEDLRKRTEIELGELQIIAESMSDNYGSLRSLREIALSHDFFISVPDYRDLAEKINRACDYVLKMLGNPSDYEHLAFFGDYDGTLYDVFIEGLDTDSFTAIPKVEYRHLKENEKELLDKLFSDVPPEQLAFQINKAAESAEMRKLIEMSDKYASLLKVKH